MALVDGALPLGAAIGSPQFTSMFFPVGLYTVYDYLFIYKYYIYIYIWEIILWLPKMEDFQHGRLISWKILLT
jgi:hypothetical protein